MAELDRLTGLYGAVFIDLWGTTEAASERIKIADTQAWSLSQEVRTEDATIKGEVDTRSKIIRTTNRIRAERWVQGPAVFSREVRQYLTDVGARIGSDATGESGGSVAGATLATMGTTAGVDSGAMGTSGTFFGGQPSATGFGTGTASNVRPPVHFALYGVNSAAAGTLIGAVAAGEVQSGSVIITGQGFLVRGDFSVPRDGLMTDTLEILVDGALNYAERA